MSDLNFINDLVTSSPERSGSAILQLVHTGSAQDVMELVAALTPKPNHSLAREVSKFIPWPDLFKSAALQNDARKYDALLSLMKTTGVNQWSDAFDQALGTPMLDHVTQKAQKVLEGPDPTSYSSCDCLASMLKAAAVIPSTSFADNAWKRFDDFLAAHDPETLIFPWEDLCETLARYGDVQGACRLVPHLSAGPKHRLLASIHQSWPLSKIAPVLELCLGSQVSLDDLFSPDNVVTPIQRTTVQWLHVLTNHARNDVLSWMWSSSPYASVLQETWPHEDTQPRIGQDIIRHLKSAVMSKIIHLTSDKTSSPQELCQWHDNLSAIGKGGYEKKILASRLLNSKRWDLINTLHAHDPQSCEEMFLLHVQGMKDEAYQIEILAAALDHIKSPSLQAVLCSQAHHQQKSPTIQAFFSRTSLIVEMQSQAARSVPSPKSKM